MRRLLECLVPGERPISWKWIGGMLAFYVVTMAAVAGLLATHHSLAEETGATVAAGGKLPAAAGQVRRVRYQNGQDRAHPF